ncbi:MAG TPA: hypothetical protein VFA60_09920 [Terriglobales bacterium]|nr:hypothetical protein [Terriglobales bacterium]
MTIALTKPESPDRPLQASNSPCPAATPPASSPVGSLLPGFSNDRELLDHVGFTSSFRREEREKLKAVLQPLARGKGFTGRAPRVHSRWSTERSGEWEALEPTLVCEVSYDPFSGGRFRHSTRFLCWRPDKGPKECRFDQVERTADLGFFP